MNTDGNLAALDAYLREQDALDEADRIYEEAKQELSDALYGAFYDGNPDVVLEVIDHTEQDQPSREEVEEACNAIAERYDDLEAVEYASISFKL